jgi:hypothetical protein
MVADAGRGSTAVAAEPVDGGSAARLVVLVVAAVVWVLAAGAAGWAAVREPLFLPIPGLAIGPDELAPLVDEPITGGGGHTTIDGYWHLRVNVGEEGSLYLEMIRAEYDLPEMVPARPPADLTFEQRQAFDLATLQGEEGIARWRAEVGHDGPAWVPRGRVVADERVACVRVVVSADRAGPIDRVALAEPTATVRDRIEASLEVHGACGEVGRG